jgi:hypothetical protein
LEESESEEEDQDVGYAFIDDEQVLSSDEKPKKALKKEIKEAFLEPKKAP